jgi:NAD-dependent deacetylase
MTKIEQAGRLLKKSRSPAFFTGAGMSKESGIPTFRDAMDGLWSDHRPEDLATPAAFHRDPAKVRAFYEYRREIIRGCKPNAGHHAIADLENAGSNVVVITQNVDGFHEAAGSSKVFALHGNIMEERCHDGCPGSRQLDGQPGICPVCKKDTLRPNVVWFGESLDEDLLRRSTAAMMTCDILFIIGTSGLVYPAAGLANLAMQRGFPVIEINPEPTPFTDKVDLFLPGAAAKFLPKICRCTMD